MPVANIILAVGYTLIGYASYRLFKLNKNSVVINKLTFRKIESNIREDERKSIIKEMYLNDLNKEDNNE